MSFPIIIIATRHQSITQLLHVVAYLALRIIPIRWSALGTDTATDSGGWGLLVYAVVVGSGGLVLAWVCFGAVRHLGLVCWKLVL